MTETTHLDAELERVELLGQIHDDVRAVLRAAIVCVFCCAALTGLAVATAHKAGA